MKSKKKLWLILAAVILAAAIGVGIWFGIRGKGEPVKVFPFRYVGMTEYWGDNQESYGPVSTDRIQTVYVSDTQIITEIAVKQGDTVKKGDLLMTFDTTLSDLAVERKRLGVEKLKLQLEDAEGRLWDIKNMKPMVIPSTKPDNDTEDTDTGRPINGNIELSDNAEYDGSGADSWNRKKCGSLRGCTGYVSYKTGPGADFRRRQLGGFQAAEGHR
jgi:multidrug efflux pump subunit AcrA (membrane-fusion protein)